MEVGGEVESGVERSEEEIEGKQDVVLGEEEDGGPTGPVSELSSVFDSLICL